MDALITILATSILIVGCALIVVLVFGALAE